MLKVSRLVRVALFSAVVLAPAPLPAADIDLYAWQFFDGPDAGDPKSSSAQLIYGVPETDDIQVSGSCDASDSKVAVPHLIFGVDVGSLSDGAETELRISSGDVEQTLNGLVQLAENEEGLDGVLVSLDVSDPLWTLLEQKDKLSYSVPNLTDAKLSLKRGREAIGQFLAACRKLAPTPSDNTKAAP